jgi:DNA-binding winged helix-turn-helix (wHTH) protein
VHVRFGEFTLDTDTRQVFGADGEIHLSSKADELLKILVDNRPRALSKNELHEHLWPVTFVSEVNLATLIAEIREALADDARRPGLSGPPVDLAMPSAGRLWTCREPLLQRRLSAGS